MNTPATSAEWTQERIAAVRKNHPAKFNDAILEAIGRAIAEHDDTPTARPLTVLDPFGGVGGIHALDSTPHVTTYAVELEPEWAFVSSLAGWTHCGDFMGFGPESPFRQGDAIFAMQVPGPKLFDIIVTSPAYGNRMADHHVAKDDSKRLTYTHRLGRALTPGNSGGVQWGAKYRKFHLRAWWRADRMLRPGGLFILNVKDHVRKGKVQEVSEFHRKVFGAMDYELLDEVHVATRGMGFGANQQVEGGLKVDHETVFVFRKPLDGKD